MKTIQDFLANHIDSKADISVMTVYVNDPTGLGRIIKDGNGNIQKIVNETECNDHEKKILEINTGILCFSKKFLDQNISHLKKALKTGEYYITDLIEIALKGEKKISCFVLEDTKQFQGFNTPEQYKTVLQSCNDQ